jgi:hypothetical protein
MDPATIAAGAAALLAPYLKKAGEEFAGEAGKYVQGKARDVWQKIRAALDGDPPAKVVLDRFESDPDANADEFAAKVEEKIGADRPLAEAIAADVAEVKRKGPSIHIVQKIGEAEELIGIRAKRVAAGTIDLTQEVTVAKEKVVGGEFEEIG